jgi:hypothetical protein
MKGFRPAGNGTGGILNVEWNHRLFCSAGKSPTGTPSSEESGTIMTMVIAFY